MDSAVSVPLPPGFQIAELSGPLIIAYLVHWGLCGSLAIQLYLYYEAFPNDRLSTKCLVYGVYTVEIAQTILITHDAFSVFGYGFGNLSALTSMHFNWLTVPIMSGFVACVGQFFYAYRIYVLSNSKIIPTLIVAVSSASMVGGLIAGAFGFIAGDMTRVNSRRISVVVGIWCGGCAVCDILIATCTTYYLAKGGSGYRQTRVLISRLIRLTIETGSITAVVALANLVLYFAFPGKTYYIISALIAPKLYANTILAVLNARIQILGGRTTYTASSDIANFLSFPTHLRAGENPTSENSSNVDVAKSITTTTALVVAEVFIRNDVDREEV
ncbi:hypothetical protein GGX14DRAFT_456735 [Mycena pura]|uniref:DUF6534 domain-containing protein n=1 Tax=Mycena pura TaxID=153505 RepID=A0AAD6VA68_9AGAR|nr:hypothetical protein GGX14DRAFT_456735 [Mycena pura]